jgi:hypothetical protein
MAKFGGAERKLVYRRNTSVTDRFLIGGSEDAAVLDRQLILYNKQYITKAQAEWSGQLEPSTKVLMVEAKKVFFCCELKARLSNSHSAGII